MHYLGGSGLMLKFILNQVFVIIIIANNDLQKEKKNYLKLFSIIFYLQINYFKNSREEELNVYIFLLINFLEQIVVQERQVDKDDGGGGGGGSEEGKKYKQQFYTCIMFRSKQVDDEEMGYTEGPKRGYIRWSVHLAFGAFF